MPAPPDHRETARRERARLWLVRLIMAFYLALLGEGVLRKWVFPGASNALVFLRDPMMLLIVVAHLRAGVSRTSRGVLSIGGLGLLALMLCAACQAATTETSLPVLLAGLRNYAFFAPLCVAIRDGFHAADYRRWIGLNMRLALPVAGLVALQYAASPGAGINAVPGGGNEGVFLVAADVVRPYGLFSFSLGHSAFAAWMAGLALAVLMGGHGMRLGWIGRVAGVAGIVAMGVLSGSRTYFLLAGSVGLCFVGTAAMAGSSRTRVTALAAGAAVAAAALVALFAVPRVAVDLIERQAAAVASEGSTFDRIGEVVGGFVGEAGRVPVFGYGLGSGTNIAAFLATGSTGHILAEYELTRIVQELGPLFGGLYLSLRWGFLAWLAWLTWGATARGNLQPACFLGFLVPVFLAHDITLQNTMIGIGWFAAGILLAAERVGGELGAARSARPARWAHAGGAAA